ncbi:thioredoxin family protein [Clostridium botulinum 202F]|nr:thioredoxin family protein [Clostridium botulinum 202F]KAI3348422.1 thioredoxin family protein [Clostridium botulinum]KON12752.1 thioredoxin [Clostridium botulinum]MBY6985860.1 thioredoxin family protein [Clostridium botulinum]NFG98932.1 thioredoxin family protein [Clostridium botulinum]
MKILKSKIEVEELIKENNMTVVYFSANTCGACVILKEKIKELLYEYRNIKICEVLGDESIDVTASFDIYSAPIMIFFIDGKEVFRESKYASIEEIKKKIDRYYNLYF